MTEQSPWAKPTKEEIYKPQSPLREGDKLYAERANGKVELLSVIDLPSGPGLEAQSEHGLPISRRITAEDRIPENQIRLMREHRRQNMIEEARADIHQIHVDIEDSAVEDIKVQRPGPRYVYEEPVPMTGPDRAPYVPDDNEMVKNFRVIDPKQEKSKFWQ